jgi:hypothetical protein
MYFLVLRFVQELSAKVFFSFFFHRHLLHFDLSIFVVMMREGEGAFRDEQTRTQAEGQTA